MKKGCISFLAVLLIVGLVAVFVGPSLLNRILLLYYPKTYTEFVEAKAEEFGLDENLVYAIIHAESKFDDEAKSHAGATGLMQLTEETFDWINAQYPPDSETPDILRPADNIHAGCALLRLLIDQYGDLDTALAAYNAGMGNVSKWLEDEQYSQDGASLDEIPFPETRKYVSRVRRNYRMYEKLYGNTAS